MWGPGMGPDRYRYVGAWHGTSERAWIAWHCVNMYGDCLPAVCTGVMGARIRGCEDGLYRGMGARMHQTTPPYQTGAKGGLCMQSSQYGLSGRNVWNGHCGRVSMNHTATPQCNRMSHVWCGMVVWWHGGMVPAWWMHGAVVAWWHGSMVIWWYGGMVVWWYSGVVVW